MNRKNVIIQMIIFFVFLFHTSTGSAQVLLPQEKNISLTEAIALAMKNNKELLIQQGEIAMAISNEKVIKKERLPNLGFESTISLLDNIYQYESGLFHSSKTYQVPRVTYDFSLQADIPLYEGGRIKNKERLAKIETAGLNLDFQFQQRKTQLQIITAFLNVLHIEEQQKLISEKIKEDELIINQIAEMQKNGLVTSNEVLRAKLLLSTHQLASSDLDKEKKIIAEQLRPVLGIEDDELFHLNTANILTQNLLGHPATFQESYSLLNQEQIKKVALTGRQLEIEKENLKASNLPSLHAFGSYAYSYPNFKFFPPEEFLYRNGGIGLKLHIPISSFYKNRAKFTLANQAINNAALKLKEAEEQVKKDIQIAQIKYDQVSEKIKISKEAIVQAEENYRIVKTKYLNQLSLITELMDANQAYLEAESKLISLNIEQKLKYYQLQFSLGNI